MTGLRWAEAWESSSSWLAEQLAAALDGTRPPPDEGKIKKLTEEEVALAKEAPLVNTETPVPALGSAGGA